MKAYGVQGMNPLFKYVLDPVRVRRPMVHTQFVGKRMACGLPAREGLDAFLQKCVELDM